MRTSKGRIILPCYLWFGLRGNSYSEAALRRPLVGGFADGDWVSAEAHYYDADFSSSYVLYSDDEGQTWQQASSGELHIFRDGSFFSTA